MDAADWVMAFIAFVIVVLITCVMADVVLPVKESGASVCFDNGFEPKVFLFHGRWWCGGVKDGNTTYVLVGELRE